MSWRDFFSLVALTLLMVFIFGFGIGYKVLTYKECRRFGHSVMYCFGR